ncbi:MAG: topoisomerase IV [Clostridia bacterium]|nr:topoisomerase IV [Clostridia bacterium]
MAKKKTQIPIAPEVIAEIQNQPITETIEKNYMPYVMSVIISRAIPEIDGFKPSHRKLLYTMHKMGLMSGPRVKSAKIVGATMELNPHGDAAIYETLVRLTKGNESLLHPFIDSKGSFGKHYSNDAFSASRYTEAKLDPFCAELFSGIEKNAVDMVPNYDNTTKEPALLPTTFPNILVSPNMGIAVGMASQICSFNLGEVCDGTIALLKNPKITVEKMLDIIKAPDFPTGGQLIYDRDQMREIFETGRGSFRVRARYTYDKKNNSIDIVQIPYSTVVDSIIKSIRDLVHDSKVKEITDCMNSIDKSAQRLITIDLRRGADPDAVMARLYKLTTLEDSFSCNFNVLIDHAPRQLGVMGILNEWIRFRRECLVREFTYDLAKKKDKLHLLRGLGKILLDIDKAIRIVRETEKESDVVPNLMAGFKIDQIQAEYIAEIKLRHLNREYIIGRIKEIEALQQEIAELEELIGDELKQKAYIAKQLADIKKKYAKPRQTQLIYAEDIVPVKEETTVENYDVRIVLTRDGYFKKITHQSLRGSDEQKLKDGDVIACSEDTENRAELLVFTNQAQAYKAKLDDFGNTKASALGDFLPAFLKFDDGELPIMAKALTSFDPKHHIVFIFANGKGVRIPVTAYETKSNRRKLSGAFSASSPIVAAFYEADQPIDVLMISDAGKAILIRSSLIPEMTTRTSSGVSLFTLKKTQKIISAVTGDAIAAFSDASKCKKIKIPASGVTLSSADSVKNQVPLE